MWFKWQAPPSFNWGMKAGAIFLALLCHGLFSSPAPADPGLAEAVIMLCLLVAAAPQLPAFLDAPNLLAQPAKMAWLWLLFVPLGIGLYQGYELRDLTRDLVALAFLGIPILIGRLPQRMIKMFAAMLALTGTLLAARYWIITGAAMGKGLAHLNDGDNLFYLCLDSTMLFAAIYLPNLIIGDVRVNFRSWLMRGLCLLGAFLCWGTLAGMQMRGALCLAALAISLYALMCIRRPLVPMIIAAVAVIMLVFFWPSIARILLKLLEKQRLVGFNARDDDFAAIWKIISGDPLVFLFGAGWGKIYSSPAVGGYWVNYSHSALGYFLLKTGLAGVIAVGVYLFTILGDLPSKWRRHAPMLIALIPPLVLSFTIYTSYKFLSCGMLLLLLQNLNAHSDPEPG